MLRNGWPESSEIAGRNAVKCPAGMARNTQSTQEKTAHGPKGPKRVRQAGARVPTGSQFNHRQTQEGVDAGRTGTTGRHAATEHRPPRRRELRPGILADAQKDRAGFGSQDSSQVVCLSSKPTFFTEATFATFSQLRKRENIELRISQPVKRSQREDSGRV